MKASSRVYKVDFGKRESYIGAVKNKVEDLVFSIFNPIVACMVLARRTDLALRLQDDFTVGMSLFKAAVYFKLINDPWPKSAHNVVGDPQPRLGNVATPQE